MRDLYMMTLAAAEAAVSSFAWRPQRGASGGKAIMIKVAIALLFFSFACLVLTLTPMEKIFREFDFTILLHSFAQDTVQCGVSIATVSEFLVLSY